MANLNQLRSQLSSRNPLFFKGHGLPPIAPFHNYLYILILIIPPWAKKPAHSPARPGYQ